MTNLPFIPETAPFTPEQRAWLNGFLAGLFSPGPPGPSPAPRLNAAPAADAEPLLVLYGSQTGSAEGLAQRVAKQAQQRGFAPKILALNDYEQADLAAGGKALIISSTWGDGDPPDNAVNFWSWLKADSAPRLDKLQFAVLGLGDRNYSDFCGASKKFDTQLEALGAKRLAPRIECDVDYEASAKRWMEALWDQLAGQDGTGRPLPAAGANGTNGAHGVTPPTNEAAKGASPSVFGKLNPFPARLLKNVLLNQPGSAKEVRHYELSLHGSGLDYKVGDALGVVPANCHALVDQLLTTLRCHGDEPVLIGQLQLPLREALTCHCDITKPTPELIASIAQLAGAPVSDPARVGEPSPRAGSESGAPRTEFVALSAPERRDDLKKWLWGRDVHDLLNLLPAPMPVAQLLPCLRKLAPRLYSISSSPKAHPGEVHLTVSSVRYESHGRERKGVASTFLADRVGDADFVRVFVQPASGFKLPASGDTAVIMVGPGTGIAPFRAFLEERQAARAQGKNWLFFGDQKRGTDFLYAEQINGWVIAGFLTRLDLAFSRDQTEKIYVQDRMLANATELWAWLEAGAHFYVCGDASRMAKDVDAALHRIVETVGGKSAEEAQAYVAGLKADKRYQRDVY